VFRQQVQELMCLLDAKTGTLLVSRQWWYRRCGPQVFGQAAWEQSARKYFRFLHFTTEDARAASPTVLRFSCNLPPIGKVLQPHLWALSQVLDFWTHGT
jgi:hypothetical protein